MRARRCQIDRDCEFALNQQQAVGEFARRAAQKKISAPRGVEGPQSPLQPRTGERTVLWDRHPDLAWDLADIPKSAVTAGRVLIVDCHETAAATVAARYAREAGVPTIVDVEKVRPGIADLLHQIDIIITAQDFPCALTGHEDLGRALAAMADEFRAPIVCATLGEHGSLARCGGREIRTPAFQVDRKSTRLNSSHKTVSRMPSSA